MNKIDLIIDALSISQNSVWSKLNEQALAAARELQAEKLEREWVGLTIEEIKEMLYGLHGDDRTPMLTLVNVVEAKLKEKNA